MLQGQVVKCLILFITIVKCTNSFEIFISRAKYDKNQTIEDFKSFHNRSCEISLFQTRYITIRVYPRDLRRHQNDNSSVIGFKFQVKSTNPDVVNIQKNVVLPTTTKIINDSKNILNEDLYICEY